MRKRDDFFSSVTLHPRKPYTGKKGKHSCFLRTSKNSEKIVRFFGSSQL